MSDFNIVTVLGKSYFVSSRDKCNTGLLPLVRDEKRSATSLTRGEANKSIFALRHGRKILSAYPVTKIQVGSLFRIRKKSNPNCMFARSS